MPRTQTEIAQFVPASELPTAKEKILPSREDRRSECDMYGRDSGLLYAMCLEGLIETKGERIVEAVLLDALGKLIDNGLLDAVMQRVLDRRLARASITVAEDHELVDEMSGIILD